ncbi:MAG: prepilin-type N-terminal cleavage/methylation domain-containing protein [Gemmatimonadaceae bacterium]
MKRSTKGFTLIELLIVVVIIGILAAIAIPKFAATKQRAYVAAVKTDLKNLATAEEGYASANNGSYVFSGTIGPNSTDTLAVAGFSFASSKGVTITLGGTAAGWSATALHSSVPSMGNCSIFYNMAPVAPATAEGVPACPAGY